MVVSPTGAAIASALQTPHAAVVPREVERAEARSARGPDVAAAALAALGAAVELLDAKVLSNVADTEAVCVCVCVCVCVRVCVCTCTYT